jgi:tetratricopeptide (TPR) repeat protein
MNFIILCLVFSLNQVDQKKIDASYNYHTKMADKFYHDGDYPNMLYHIKQKVKLDKHDVNSYSDLAYYYWSMSVDDKTRRSEFQEKAMNYLLEGLKHNKESAYMWDEIGSFFVYNFKDLIGAITFYEEAVKRKDCKMTSYHMLSAGYYKKGEYKKAINTLEECVKKFPQDKKAQSKLQELKNKLNNG